MIRSLKCPKCGVAVSVDDEKCEIMTSYPGQVWLVCNCGIKFKAFISHGGDWYPTIQEALDAGWPKDEDKTGIC